MKRLLMVLLAVIIALAMIGCGQQFDLDKYKADVGECSKSMYSHFHVLLDVIQSEINEAQMLNSAGAEFDAEAVFSGACETNDTSKAQLQEANNEIADLYSKVADTNVEGSAGEDIHDHIVSLYQDYEKLFSIVLNPSETELTVDGVAAAERMVDEFRMLKTLVGVEY